MVLANVILAHASAYQYFPNIRKFESAGYRIRLMEYILQMITAKLFIPALSTETGINKDNQKMTSEKASEAIQPYIEQKQENTSTTPMVDGDDGQSEFEEEDDGMDQLEDPQEQTEASW
ncbi:hypothetical protein CHU98_g11529 [Xylaria longipes]|nr:hypothetical protein CHU98_g11529 [Xylaria longipes]